MYAHQQSKKLKVGPPTSLMGVVIEDIKTGKLLVTLPCYAKDHEKNQSHGNAHLYLPGSKAI